MRYVTARRNRAQRGDDCGAWWTRSFLTPIKLQPSGHRHVNYLRQPQEHSTNVTRVQHRVSGDMRTERNGHDGAVLWFTGLSGAGKSTLAVQLEQRLFCDGYQVYVLDGDNH